MSDTFPIKKIDHLRFYVSNAKQAAHYYCDVLGFTEIAYAGLETGSREESSHVVGQGDIRIVLTSPLRPGGPVSEHIAKHGDGVKDVCFEVGNVEEAFRLACERGAKPAYEPMTLSDDDGEIRLAAIRTYGDTIHTLLNRDNYRGWFLPTFEKRNDPAYGVGLLRVDHIVGNVEVGKMNEWVDFYANVLGFKQLVHFDDQDISTEYTALMSKVMSSDTGVVKFPINEPAAGRRKSQIDEYLEYYGGPGVQHIALETDDIIQTVRRIIDRGLRFLRVPKTYYEMLPERVGRIDEEINDLADLGILVDRDQEGYLLQLFTKPVSDRPTLFYEIIQRKGSRSFGKGNFKALFEAIEREQALRGTL